MKPITPLSNTRYWRAIHRANMRVCAVMYWETIRKPGLDWNTRILTGLNFLTGAINCRKLAEGCNG